MRVVVVADSSLVRARLEALLAADPGLVVVAELESRPTTENSASLRELVAPYQADVVVWAPSRDEADAAPQIGNEDESDADDSRPGIVVLSDDVDARRAHSFLRSGVHAILPLGADESALLAALHAVAAGLVVLPPSLVPEAAAIAAGSTIPTLPQHDLTLLTPRERQVLELLAQGWANKEIAPRLGITEHTVKAHVAAIYERLHARNRAEAVVEGARRGLILL